MVSVSWQKVFEQIKHGDKNAISWFQKFLTGELNGSGKETKDFLHQQGNIVFLANNKNGALIADSVGLGKTFTALISAFYYALNNTDEKNFHILILCPPKLIEGKWISELERYFPTVSPAIYHIHSMLSEKDITIYNLPNYPIQIVLCSPDTINRHWDCYTGIRCNKIQACRSIRSLLEFKPWDIVIIDEAHNYTLKSDSNRASAKRRTGLRKKGNYKVCLEVCKNAKRRFLLTATPQGNTVIELLGLLGMVNNHFNNLVAVCFKKLLKTEVELISKNTLPLEMLISLENDMNSFVSKLKRKKKGELAFSLLEVSKALNKILQRLVRIKTSQTKEQAKVFNWFFNKLNGENLFLHGRENPNFKDYKLLFYFLTGQKPKKRDVLRNFNRVKLEFYHFHKQISVKCRTENSSMRTVVSDIPDKTMQNKREVKICVIQPKEMSIEFNEIKSIEDKLSFFKDQFEQHSASRKNLIPLRIISTIQSRLSSELFSYWKTTNRKTKPTVSVIAIKKSLIDSDQDFIRETSDEQVDYLEAIHNVKLPEVNLGSILQNKETHLNFNQFSKGSTIKEFPYDSTKLKFVVEELIKPYFKMQDGIFVRLPILIFTSYQDTLNYISDRIDLALDEMCKDHDTYPSFHKFYRKSECFRYYGTLSTRQKEEFAKFVNLSESEPNLINPVIISTDAGSHGFDLPFVGMVINYDLPWNPITILQRIGRADRINRTTKIDEILEFLVEHEIQNELDYSKRQLYYYDIKVKNLINSTKGGNDFRKYEILSKKIEAIWSTVGIYNSILDQDLETGFEIHKELEKNTTEKAFKEEIAKLNDEKTMYRGIGLTSKSGLIVNVLHLNSDFHPPDLPKGSSNPNSLVFNEDTFSLIHGNSETSGYGSWKYEILSSTPRHKIIFEFLAEESKTRKKYFITQLYKFFFLIDRFVIPFDLYDKMLSLQFSKHRIKEIFQNFERVSNKYDLKFPPLQSTYSSVPYKFIILLNELSKNCSNASEYLIIVANQTMQRGLQKMLQGIFEENSYKRIKIARWANLNSEHLEGKTIIATSSPPYINKTKVLTESIFRKLLNADVIWIISPFEAKFLYSCISNPDELPLVSKKQTHLEEICDLYFTKSHDTSEFVEQEILSDSSLDDEFLISENYGETDYDPDEIVESRAIQTEEGFQFYLGVHDSIFVINETENTWKKKEISEIKNNDKVVFLKSGANGDVFRIFLEQIKEEYSTNYARIEQMWKELEKYRAKENLSLTQLQKKLEKNGIKREIPTIRNWLKGLILFPNDTYVTITGIVNLLEKKAAETEIVEFVKSIKNLRSIHQRLGKLIIRFFNGDNRVSTKRGLIEMGINANDVRSELRFDKVIKITSKSVEGRKIGKIVKLKL